MACYDEILDVFNKVSDTSSRNEKMVILEKASKTEIGPEIKKIVTYAYSPLITYGITGFNETDEIGETNPFCMFNFLDSLNERMVTGNAAIEQATSIATSLSPSKKEIFRRILMRDLRIGVAGKTFNKIWKDAVPSTPYMRCASFSAKSLKKIKFPCYSEVKMDGMYVAITVRGTGSEVEYTSRNSQPKAFNLKATDDALNQFADENGAYVITGEALLVDKDENYLDREVGNGILESDDCKPENIRFVVWDYIPLVDYIAGSSDMTMVDRRAFLDSLITHTLRYNGVFSINQVIGVSCSTYEEAVEHAKHVMTAGGEGTIIKNKKMRWKNGNSPDQVKVKAIAECDLIVVDIQEGKGKYKGCVGSLICESSDGLLSVGVSGMSDALRKKYFEERDDVIGKVISVKFNDVLYNEQNGKHSLFLPRMVELRSDKTEADSLERIMEQLEASVLVVEECFKEAFGG